MLALIWCSRSKNKIIQASQRVYFLLKSVIISCISANSCDQYLNWLCLWLTLDDQRSNHSFEWERRIKSVRNRQIHGGETQGSAPSELQEDSRPSTEELGCKRQADQDQGLIQAVGGREEREIRHDDSRHHHQGGSGECCQAQGEQEEEA